MTPYDHAPGSPHSGEAARAQPILPKHGGSQKRKRDRRWPIALDAEEEAAADAELSKMAYGRAMLLGSPGPRARRKPHVDAQALGRATTELNYLGNIFNQIAHKLNAGGELSLARLYLDALANVRRTLAVIREAAAGRADDCHDNQGQPAR